MSSEGLKQRVMARDRLLLQAEGVNKLLNDEVLAAFARGELALVEEAVQRHEARLAELTEDLRIYQAELHAQADELQASQARSEALVQRFAALFAGMPVACVLVDHKGLLLECNTLAARLLNLPRRSETMVLLHRLIDSSDYQDRVRPALLQAQSAGSATLEGVGFFGQGGRRFTGDLCLSRLPDAAGAAGPGQAQLVCAVIDRTEHLQDLRALGASAAALRQSEAFLTESARLARVGGWELTLRPHALRWSSQLRQMLELPADEPATLEATLARCASYDRKSLANAVARAELGQPFEIEIDMVTTSGRPLRVLAVGSAEMGEQRVVRVLGALQDITSQHQVRRQLGDLTERLAIANEAGGIGVWDWNLAEGTLEFDSRLREMLGLQTTPAGTLVQALAPNLPPHEREHLEAAMQVALSCLDPLNVELQRDDDGGGRWLHVTGRAQADAQGRVQRVIGCAWDSSPEHEALRLLAAKEAAESANRAKSAFLSRMSHELRTPLNAILGFAQLMRLEADSGDLVLKPHRVTLIESAARHLLELVNEVLDVSRIEAGHVDVRLVPLDLRCTLAEALPMVQGLAERMDVAIDARACAGEPCLVHADRLRLREVLINLLSNAIKYNVSGGQVVCRVASHEAGVELSVRDTGIGLSETQQAELFQPFNRVGAERSGIEGSGMGLFVSRRFVELMGGQILVASAPGQGTTMTVRLRPAAAA
jgi:signal transduction histidine kinase